MYVRTHITYFSKNCPGNALQASDARLGIRTRFSRYSNNMCENMFAKKILARKH